MSEEEQVVIQPDNSGSNPTGIPNPVDGTVPAEGGNKPGGLMGDVIDALRDVGGQVGVGSDDGKYSAIVDMSNDQVILSGDTPIVGNFNVVSGASYNYATDTGSHQFYIIKHAEQTVQIHRLNTDSPEITQAVI